MPELSLKEVVSSSELAEFISFPHKLYSGHPYWVPSLRFDDKETFSKTKNPAFKYCEAKLWLVYKNGQIAGRVAGIINRSYIDKWKNKYARFGWLDFIDDFEVLVTLMNGVENWALEKGMTGVHGPMGFTDFDPEGMLTEGFDEIASMTTIYNYPYYPRYLEKHGYKKDVDWLEFEVLIPKQLPEKITELASIVEKKYGLHSLKVSKSKELFVYAKQIFQLLNIAYKDLYGVVHLTDEQIDGYIKQYFSFIQPDFVSVVLDTNNDVKAFAISMPSLSRALQKSRGKLFPFGFIHLYRALKKNTVADLYLIAVHPDLQSKGVNSMLIRDLVNTFIKRGISKAITHPALEYNNKVLTLWKGYDARQIKRRRCYLKLLNST